MSSLKPPLPPSTPLSAPLPPSSSSPRFDSPKSASPVPLILGTTALLVSVGLWMFREALGQEWYAILGYFLTPYVVFATLTWDVIWQRNGQKNPWFDVRPAYTNVLRVAAIASLAVAIPHILAIGRRVGEIAVEQGWG